MIYEGVEEIIFFAQSVTILFYLLSLFPEL